MYPMSNTVLLIILIQNKIIQRKQGLSVKPTIYMNIRKQFYSYEKVKYPLLLSSLQSYQQMIIPFINEIIVLLAID